MSSPSIFAVVLSWNGFEDICSCVDSLFNSTIPFQEIVIVDNFSTDGTAKKILEKYKENSIVNIFLNQKNLGFAGGVNIGIEYSIDKKADYIFLINDDATIQLDCLSQLLCLNSSCENDLPTIFVPRILYSSSKKIWQGASYFSPLKVGINSSEKNKDVSECSNETRSVSCATACALLISRSVFENIGLFDEKFFFYFEDLDFTVRAYRSGAKILYAPSANVFHKLESVEKDRTSPFVMYHLARSHVIFSFNNFQGNYFYLCYSLLIISFPYTFYRISQISRGSKSFDAATSWFKGAIDGLKVSK
jgi:GT2 family glycosyltransferase